MIRPENKFERRRHVTALNKVRTPLSYRLEKLSHEDGACQVALLEIQQHVTKRDYLTPAISRRSILAPSCFGAELLKACFY